MAVDTGVLAVFTAKTSKQILEAGGSQSWVLNQHSMRGVEYVVCTRNSDPAYDEECGVRSELHNSAFMVGKVSGMTRVDHRNDRDRYRVDFSEYALMSVPDFRHGSSRNPVTYSNVGQAKQNGLDIEALEFLPMPSGDGEKPPMYGAGMKGLTIAQAKEGLSIQFGVPPRASRSSEVESRTREARQTAGLHVVAIRATSAGTASFFIPRVAER